VKNEWKTQRYHLGNRKEIFDAELYAITEGLKIAQRRHISNDHNFLRLFTDSTAGLRRIQGPSQTSGQWLVNRIPDREESLNALGITVE
jgi:hypothetical protein